MFLKVPYDFILYVYQKVSREEGGVRWWLNYSPVRYVLHI